AKASAAKTSPTKTSAAKTSAAKTSPAKTSPARSSPAKAAAARTAAQAATAAATARARQEAADKKAAAVRARTRTWAVTRIVDGVDAGLRQIKGGLAVARYDARDGYGAHTRETAYVRADDASPTAACAPADAPSGTAGGLSGGWPVAGDEHPCPQSRPVKGNE